MTTQKTICNECACWKPRDDLIVHAKTGEKGKFGECRRAAPAAEPVWGTKNYYDHSLILWASWPVTSAADGFCFDGISKVRIPGLEK